MNHKLDKNLDIYRKNVDELITLNKTLKESSFSDVKSLVEVSKELINKRKEAELMLKQCSKTGLEFLVEYPEKIEFVINYAKEFKEKWTDYLHKTICELRNKETNYLYKSSNDKLIEKAIYNIVHLISDDIEFKYFMVYSSRLCNYIILSPPEESGFNRLSYKIIKNILLNNALYVEYDCEIDKEHFVINILK